MEERSEQFECSYCGSEIQLSKRGRSDMNRVAPIGKLNVASLPNRGVYGIYPQYFSEVGRGLWPVQ